MGDRKVTVSGLDYLLLWEPGDLSPFQAANAYAFTFEPPADPARLRSFLEPKVAGAAPPQPILFQTDRDLKVVSLLVNRDFRSSFRNWYPFHTDTPLDPVNLLYGPERDSLAGLLDLELVVQALQQVDGYVLGTGRGAGLGARHRERARGAPVRVRRGNGTADLPGRDRAERPHRGALAHGGCRRCRGRPAAHVARRRAPGGEPRVVGRGRPAVERRVRLTAGEPYARSGALVAAAGLEGTAGRLSWSVEAAGSFENPDTTGVVRLHGMEGDSLGVDLSEELAWPAAPPDPLGPLASFTAANRGKLLYRDFRSYDAFGGAVLHDIDWSGAVLTDYADSGRPGPYEVLGSSAGAAVGRSLVLEYDLPNDGDWVGAQLPVVAGSLADLSTAKSVSVRMRGRDLVGTMQVHLEVGAIGEDIDDDDVLDAEPSATATGFAFNDSGNGVVLKVGAGPRREGNGRLDSEDRDGSGTLTPEESGRIATWPAETTVDGTWQVFTFALDDAARAKLEQARSIRIVVESTVADTRGRLLIDQIAMAGSAFWVDATAGTATVREVAEPFAADDPGPGNRLADVQADAMRLFHPAGETQEVLEISWTGASTDITVTGYTAKTTGGIVYDEAVVYVRGVGIGATSVAFALLDADGAGIRWTLDASALADEAWHEVRASRRDGSVTLDGAPRPEVATFDAEHGVLAMLRVVVAGATDGRLYLDEVHLREPRSSFGAGLRAEASWSRPGAVWQPGGVAVLANLDLTQRLSAVTAGFAELYGTPSTAADVTSRTHIGADVLYARIAADVILHLVDGTFTGSGGHRLTIPAAASPVTLSDSFSLAGNGEFSRADSLRVQPSGVMSATLEARAAGTIPALEQSWTAALAVKAAERLDLGLDLLLSQSSTGYALVEEWYGARWAREAALLAPWYGGATLERLERLSAKVSGGVGAVEGGFSLDGSATGSDYTALSRAQEDRIEEAWSLSWKAPGEEPGAVVVSLRYARSLAMTGYARPGSRSPRRSGSSSSSSAANAGSCSACPWWRYSSTTPTGSSRHGTGSKVPPGARRSTSRSNDGPARACSISSSLRSLSCRSSVSWSGAATFRATRSRCDPGSSATRSTCSAGSGRTPLPISTGPTSTGSH